MNRAPRSMENQPTTAQETLMSATTTRASVRRKSAGALVSATAYPATHNQKQFTPAYPRWGILFAHKLRNVSGR